MPTDGAQIPSSKFGLACQANPGACELKHECQSFVPESPSFDPDESPDYSEIKPRQPAQGGWYLYTLFETGA